MTQVRSRKNLSLILRLILLVCVAALIGAFITDLPKYYALNRKGNQISGTVISKEEHNHRFIGVRYEVNQIKYIIKGHAEDFGESFYSIKLGDYAPITYNPNSPSDACLGNPDLQLNESIRGTGFIAIFPILIFILYLIRKKWSPKNQR